MGILYIYIYTNNVLIISIHVNTYITETCDARIELQDALHTRSDGCLIRTHTYDQCAHNQYTFEYMRHKNMWHKNRAAESAAHTFWWMSDVHMGWLRLVGSIKLQVSFAEYSLFYRALLQKGPVILSILLTQATPCIHTINVHTICIHVNVLHTHQCTYTSMCTQSVYMWIYVLYAYIHTINVQTISIHVDIYFSKHVNILISVHVSTLISIRVGTLMRPPRGRTGG